MKTNYHLKHFLKSFAIGAIVGALHNGELYTEQTSIISGLGAFPLWEEVSAKTLGRIFTKELQQKQ